VGSDTPMFICRSPLLSQAPILRGVPEIETPRIELRGAVVAIRPYESGDARALLELRLRNRDFFAPYEPSSVVAAHTIEEQLQMLDAERVEWDNDRRYTFGVFEPGGDALVGQVQLSHVMRRAMQSCTLGYFVDRAENGKGYATDATRLALRFAFEHAGLHRVEAGTLTDNHRSMRVLQKAGFRHEGTALRLLEINGVWEDHEIYAITHEEWTGDAVT
jgi:[ribosomal protein S5]-alanine N-acetyltransferase